MKTKKGFKLTIAATLLLFITSCVDREHSLYEDPRQPVTEYFDFKTKSDLTLVVDYGFEGYTLPFEVYSSYPLDEYDRLVANKSPLFAAFTDNNSSFLGNIEIPSHVETLYLYSDAFAVPKLIELEVKNGKAEYIYQPFSDALTRNISYDGTCYSIGGNKATINSNNNLFSLYDSYINSISRENRNDVIYRPYNSKATNVYSVLSNSTVLSSQSKLGDLINRLSNTLKKTDNSFYCSDSKHTNLRIANVTEDGKEVEAAHLDLVFVSASGDYHNAMGYYYYKSDEVPSAEEIKKLPKYIVFPRTTSGKPTSPIKARLQFFGEDYDKDGTDHFPAGYTIGWVLFPDLSGCESGETSLNSNANLSNVNSRINSAYNSNRVIYSDKEANPFQNYGCITISDALSEKIVIGFEDIAYKEGCGDKSYNDILFYVDCDPIEAIYDPERPEIKDNTNVEEQTRVQVKTSTLAFEDIWPSGGDYDMNDVVVELFNYITFNQNNKIKSIETKIKAVHNGATLSNAFGLLINGAIGDIDEDKSSFYMREETNQFILFDNIKTAVDNTYSIVQTFGEEGIDKLTYDDSFNPFIVVDYHHGLKSRKEVHLPKNQPTSWADYSLIGQERDFYFMDVEEMYPFAIELFDIVDWPVVTESVRIGSEGEYPRFIHWVESHGQSYSDWYLNKK